MKRYFIPITIILLVIISGCSFNAGFLKDFIPQSPEVNGEEMTGNRRPGWNWQDNSNQGLYRYSFDETNWETTSDRYFSPSYDLSVGIYTLYVQTGNHSNYWSDSGNHTTTITDFPLYSPNVWTGNYHTNDSTPTWYWDGQPNANLHRYSFDQITWYETIMLDFTPVDPLPEGTHTLYVQARNQENLWSTSGWSEVVVDTTPPTITLNCLDSLPTPNSPINVEMIASEPLDWFNPSNLIVQYGIAVNLSRLSDTRFTAQIVPMGDNIYIDVTHDVVTDLAGNGNIAAEQLHLIYNGTNINCVIVGPSGGVNTNTIQLSALFSKPVEDLVVTEISVSTGAGISGWNPIAGGQEYQFTLNLTAEGQITLQIPAGVCTGLAPDTYPNLDSPMHIINYDTTPPNVTISSGYTSPVTQNPIEITVKFTEPVHDFFQSDLVLNANCWIENFHWTTDTETKFNLHFNNDGPATIDLPADRVYDEANNANPAAPQFNITYNGTAPYVVNCDFSGTTITNTTPMNFTITFNEPVSDFTETDIVTSLTNAEYITSTLTTITDNASWNFSAIPNHPGEVIFMLPPGYVSDGSLVNATSPPFYMTFNYTPVGTFAALTINGEIYTTDNPTDGWFHRATPNGEAFNDIASNSGGQFLAVGNSKTLYYSGDAGNNWQDVSTSIAGFEQFSSVAYGNGWWVIGTQVGDIYYASDAPTFTWTYADVDPVYSDQISSITFNSASGFFMLVDKAGRAYYSSNPDPVNWMERSGGLPGIELIDVAVNDGSGRYVATGQPDGSGPLLYSTIDNGINWNRHIIGPQMFSLQAISYGTGNRWLTVGDNQILYFEDPPTLFTDNGTPAPAQNFTDVANDGILWVVSARDSSIWYSYNPKSLNNWAKSNEIASWNAIAFSPY